MSGGRTSPRGTGVGNTGAGWLYPSVETSGLDHEWAGLCGPALSGRLCDFGHREPYLPPLLEDSGEPQALLLGRSEGQQHLRVTEGGLLDTAKCTRLATA